MRCKFVELELRRCPPVLFLRNPDQTLSIHLEQLIARSQSTILEYRHVKINNRLIKFITSNKVEITYSISGASSDDAFDVDT